MIVSGSGTDEVFMMTGDFKQLWQVKNAIHSRTGIAMKDQFLVHIGNILDGASDVDDLDFGEKAELVVYTKIKPPRMLTISVERVGRRIPIKIMSNSSIDYLKMKIDEADGLSPHRQRLTVLGVPMAGPLMLDDYVPDELTPIYLKAGFKDPRWNFPVNVKPEWTGEGMKFDMDEDDTLFALHGEVGRSGIIPPSFLKNFRITFGVQHNPRCLAISGHELLRNYGIVANDTLNVELRPRYY